MVDEVGENKMAVMPLFVAITPGMKIVFSGERESGGGGGPKDEKEAAPERPATAWAEVTQPQPR